MSLQAQAARGLKWQAFEIVSRQVLSLVVFTTLARLLDPSAFGLMGLVAVYLAFVSMFVDQGIGTALIQRKELESQHINAAFWFNIFCSIVFCLATMALAGTVARHFEEPKLAPLLRWGSLILIVNAFAGVHGALFFRAMDFRRPMIRTAIANAVGGAVGVGMAFGGYGVWALIGQQISASVAGACFLWSASSWRPAFEFSLPHLRQLMGMSASVFATSLLWFVSSRTDQMLIGSMLGAVSLGYYAVATRISDLAKTTLYQPMGAVALPALAQLQEDRERLRVAVARSMEVNALVSFPCLLGLSAVAPVFVPLLLGTQWQPGGILLQIMALYVLANGLQGVIHYTILATGGPGIFLVINVLHAIGVVAACYVGVTFGSIGVVTGLLLNELFMNVPRTYALYRRTGITPWQYYKPCAVPAVAGMLMYAAVVGSRVSLDSEQGWFALALMILCGAVVYIGLMYVLARQSLDRLIGLGLAAIGRGRRVEQSSGALVA